MAFCRHGSVLCLPKSDHTCVSHHQCEETKAGLKTLAPPHLSALKGNKAENRRNLAEETGIAMSQNDPENKIISKEKEKFGWKEWQPHQCRCQPETKVDPE
jgi:hypothetical protein